MDKATLLYLLLLPNLLLMVYTLMSIGKKDGLEGFRKNALIYTTILFPVAGLAALHIPAGNKSFYRK